MCMRVPAHFPSWIHLSTFNIKFRRSEGETALERYLTGLLTELPNKNCDTIATAVPGTSEQRLRSSSRRCNGTKMTSTDSVWKR